MKVVTLRAHFDGESRPKSEDTEDRASWGVWAATSLAGAYADDEPDYSLDLIKEPNPDYEGSALGCKGTFPASTK